MITFPREVFQTLIAIGWIDGNLDAAEAQAILDAARSVGLPEDQLAQLEERTKSACDFGDISFDDLNTTERMLVYAVASWVARADDEVTGSEQAALHALATLAGISGKGRTILDDTVESLKGQANRPARLDLIGLGEAIEQVIRQHAK